LLVTDARTYVAYGDKVDGSPDLRDALACRCVDHLFAHGSIVSSRESESVVDYTEVLRRLAVNDEQFAEECVTGTRASSVELDPRTLALVRVAALVAVGGTTPSYGVEADAAVSGGATTAEIVGVLVGIVSVVGLPSVVAAAPSLAMALGCDLEDPPEGPWAG
jgi:4-carboxymuconolactone decarboxylase